MAFVTLLAIAVGVLSAIALLAVGLVEAPWQLLLLGLLAALYALQRQAGAADQAAAQVDELVASSVVTTQAVVGTGNPAAPTGPENAGSQNTSSEKSDSANGGSQDGDSVAAAPVGGNELTYRGIRYRAPKTSPNDLPKGDQIEGVYRGQPWQR